MIDLVDNLEPIVLEGFSDTNQSELWESILDDRENISRKNIWPGFSSFEDLKSYMDSCNKLNSEEYGFVLREREGPIVGTIHIFSVDFENKEAELGYGLHLKYTGKGYATIALNLLLDGLRLKGFERVFAECDEENTKSWSVAERCGFKVLGKDGTRRRYKKVLNGYY